jgi:hypothetical protein
MNSKTNEKALDAIRLLEKDGRKVYKVVLHGKKIELVLDKGAIDDDAPGEIDWS